MQVPLTRMPHANKARMLRTLQLNSTRCAGFYVGLAQGWFAEAGIELSVISPDADAYTLTPGRRVANGDAEFCLGPSESGTNTERRACSKRCMR
jgi:hypothetical protein